MIPASGRCQIWFFRKIGMMRTHPLLSRYPPSAPLIEQPPTPPPSPGGLEGSTSDIPIQDWSKLPPESAYFLGVNRGILRHSLIRRNMLICQTSRQKKLWSQPQDKRGARSSPPTSLSSGCSGESRIKAKSCEIRTSDILCHRWKTMFRASLMN